MSERLFKACTWCGLTRLLTYEPGRDPICDYCAAEARFEKVLDEAYADVPAPSLDADQVS